MVAAVRGLFEHLVMTGVRADNPVSAARRTSGSAANATVCWVTSRFLLARGGRLVREPTRLPESLPAEAVTAFVADLDMHRDRAIVLAMVLGGLRAAETRSLRLADVDMGMRRVRVVGKGGARNGRCLSTTCSSPTSAHVHIATQNNEGDASRG